MLLALFQWGWLAILLLDLAYEWPRPTKGTGPLSKWLRARLLNKALLVLIIVPMQVVTSISLFILDRDTLAMALAYVLFWIPVAIFDVVDWLGEEERYRRFKRGASEKGKELLARLKPAPQRPLPVPTS